MIIESGVIILLGFVFLVIKLPRRTLLRLLGYPVAVDLMGSAMAYVLHWGTFTGGLAAAVAGLMLSACTSIGRFAVGYIERGVYYPGRLADWSHDAHTGA